VRSRQYRSSLIIFAVFLGILVSYSLVYSLPFPVGSPLDGSPYSKSQEFQDDSFIWNNKTYSGHLGEDWAVPIGTEVYPIAKGEVVRSRDYQGNWGNVIIIKHDNLIPGEIIYSLYAHLSVRFVGENALIQDTTTPIGLSGIKGTGAHLHFEIKDYGETVIIPGPAYTMQESQDVDMLFFKEVTYFRPTKFLITIHDPNNIDNDGDGLTENQGDCNDADSTIYPGATEVCGDGIDQNCDGIDLVCAQNQHWEAIFDWTFSNCVIPPQHYITYHTYSIIQSGTTVEGNSLDSQSAIINGTINGSSVNLVLKEFFGDFCTRTFSLSGTLISEKITGNVTGGDDNCGTCNINGTFEILIDNSL